MEQVNINISEDQKLKNQLSSNQSGPHIPRILVVEDDVMYEPFWAAIAQRANPLAKVIWATSEREAEVLIEESILKGQLFDLVITDIFLSGSNTGIDLWRKYGKTLHGKVIITSGVEYQKFTQFFGKELVRPTYLQKPLVPHQCIEAIYSALLKNS